MLSTVYRLIAPRTFEPAQVEIDLDDADVLVRPTTLSICNADVRYYRGQRDAATMSCKLPMALIHEGVGVVLASRVAGFAPGQRIVMLPNEARATTAERLSSTFSEEGLPEKPEDASMSMPTSYEMPAHTTKSKDWLQEDWPRSEDWPRGNGFVEENYRPDSRFCGSGHDGFMSELIALPAARALVLPDYLDDEVAAFTEMMSVAMHAVRRFDAIAHTRRETIGVWGDGNLSYFVALVLKTIKPERHIVVVGHNRYKLADFTFVDQAVSAYELEEGFSVDHAFECCGGQGSAAAIDQILRCIAPEGTISLLGVSENPVPIDTRTVLEKGLRLFGSSRSARMDFVATLSLYEQRRETIGYLASMVGDVFEVQSVADMSRAFEADIRKSMGKTIMRWDP